MIVMKVSRKFLGLSIRNMETKATNGQIRIESKGNILTTINHLGKLFSFK